MIQIDMELPKCCDECFALDDHGDYPFCLISQDQRGYTFNVHENRMPSCPLKAQEPKPPIIKENSYGWKFYYCPSCGKEFYQNNKFNFCEKCGQAVKWE